MKFLVDNNLPPLLADWLTGLGHDAIAARDLPTGASTPDPPLSAVADVAGRIVVSKDQDLLDLHRSGGSPKRLLRVTTGNVKNFVLLKAFEDHFADAAALLATAAVVEINAVGATIGG